MKLEDWKASRLVYSTDSASVTPPAVAKPDSVTPASKPLERQKVLVKLDRKGRRGKSVTLVEGIVADAAALEAVAKKLKAACGSGGTVKEGRIELQGEHREKVLALLTELGYRPKPSGG
jgi:translation initiation factor 1